MDAKTRDLLHKAIDLAQSPGACSYQLGCVVAQYVQLTRPDLLKALYRHDRTSFDEQDVAKNFSYPEVKILRTLQCQWDSPDDLDMCDLKLAMHLSLDHLT